MSTYYQNKKISQTSRTKDRLKMKIIDAVSSKQENTDPISIKFVSMPRVPIFTKIKKDERSKVAMFKKRNL